MKRKLLPVILAIVIGVTGCMRNGSTFQEESLSYMQEKYQESFQWIEPVDGQFGSAVKSGYLSSPSFPGEKILVTGIPGDRDSFSDNYTAYLCREGAQQLLWQIVSSVDKDWKAFCEPEEVGMTLPKETTALEYLQSGGVLVKLFVNEENWEAVRDGKMEQLREALWEQKISANITVKALDRDALETLTQDTYSSYLGTGGEGRFVMNEQGEFALAKWR